MRKVAGKTWGADWKRASQEGRFPQGVLSPGWRKGTGPGPWCYSDTDHRVAVETAPRRARGLPTQVGPLPWVGAGLPYRSPLPRVPPAPQPHTEAEAGL